MEVDGRSGHALITGGSSGIGLAIAHLAARSRHSLTLIARGEERLREAARTLYQLYGVPVQTFRADLAVRSEAEIAVGDAIRGFGAPTHLVNSAGQASPGYFSALDVETFETMHAVNYLGTLYVIKAAYPHMRSAGGGRIALIASGAALTGIFGYTAYAASKFAVRGLSECLRAEARRDDISITIAYPPDTQTPQLEAENRVKPIETRAIASAGTIWSADRVAERIWRGMEDRRFAVTPGWEMSVLYRFNSLIQPILRRSFDRIADRAASRARSRDRE